MKLFPYYYLPLGVRCWSFYALKSCKPNKTCRGHSVLQYKISYNQRSAQFNNHGRASYDPQKPDQSRRNEDNCAEEYTLCIHRIISEFPYKMVLPWRALPHDQDASKRVTFNNTIFIELHNKTVSRKLNVIVFFSFNAWNFFVSREQHRVTNFQPPSHCT